MKNELSYYSQLAFWALLARKNTKRLRAKACTEQEYWNLFDSRARLNGYLQRLGATQVSMM